MMQIDSEDNYVETHPGRVEFDDDNTGAPGCALIFAIVFAAAAALVIGGWALFKLLYFVAHLGGL